MPRAVSIPVRAPSAHEDEPKIAVLAIIAVVGIAAGIGLARWGTYGPRAGSESAAESASASESETVPEPEPVADTVAEPDTEAVAETETGAETEPDTEPDTDTEAVAETETGETETAAAPAPAPETPPPAPIAPAPPTAPGAAASMRVARGRVAYLRCEGVPQRRGPVPCPRDEALEAAAWAAIDALPTCAELPAAEGEADVVVDYSSGPTEVRVRDTFASDVVRLDGARVAACLAPTLGAVPQTLGSTRLVVSFRFALRAP